MLRGLHRLVAIGYMEGMKNAEIAEALAIHPSTVSQVLAREDVRGHIEKQVAQRDGKVVDTTASVRARYKEVEMEAINEQIDLMRQCDDLTVKQRAIKDILEGAGLITEKDRLRASAFAQRDEQRVPQLVIIDRHYEKECTSERSEHGGSREQSSQNVHGEGKDIREMLSSTDAKFEEVKSEDGTGGAAKNRHVS